MVVAGEVVETDLNKKNDNGFFKHNSENTQLIFTI